MGLPLVGNDEYLKKELKILNPLGRGDRRAKSENQNLPKMENRKAEAAAGLPMVGTECSHIHRKETRRTTRPATRFHDHLVLESKSHLMIILQLENAAVRLPDAAVRGLLAEGGIWLVPGDAFGAFNGAFQRESPEPGPASHTIAGLGIARSLPLPARYRGFGPRQPN